MLHVLFLDLSPSLSYMYKSVHIAVYKDTRTLLSMVAVDLLVICLFYYYYLLTELHHTYQSENIHLDYLHCSSHSIRVS